MFKSVVFTIIGVFALPLLSMENSTGKLLKSNIYFNIPSMKKLPDGAALANTFADALYVKLSYEAVNYMVANPADGKSKQIKRFIELFVNRCLDLKFFSLGLKISESSSDKQKVVEARYACEGLRPEFDGAVESVPNSSQIRDYIVQGVVAAPLRKSGPVLSPSVTGKWWWDEYLPALCAQIQIEKSCELHKKETKALHLSDRLIPPQTAVAQED